MNKLIERALYWISFVRLSIAYLAATPDLREAFKEYTNGLVAEVELMQAARTRGLDVETLLAGVEELTISKATACEHTLAAVRGTGKTGMSFQERQERRRQGDAYGKS